MFPKNGTIALWILLILTIFCVAYGLTKEPIETYLGNLFFLIAFSATVALISFITFYKDSSKEKSSDGKND